MQSKESRENYTRIRVPGDGNCFFNSIVISRDWFSFFYDKIGKNNRIKSNYTKIIKQKSLELRKEFTEWVDKSKIEIPDFMDREYLDDTKSLSDKKKKYIQMMQKSATSANNRNRWGGTFEAQYIYNVLPENSCLVGMDNRKYTSIKFSTKL